MALLEVACFSPTAAILASEAGADRIELCKNQALGGTTPPLEWLDTVKAQVQIPVFVMIRPRGGDFDYSDVELESMKHDIDRFRPKADGFVFGILDHNRDVDQAKTYQLVQRAHPLPCTFHRAFDQTADPMRALEDVIATGCKAILSSGGAANVSGGVETLRRLIETASGRITVIPGGGVRCRELRSIHRRLAASVYHSSAISEGGELPEQDEIRRLKVLLSGRR